MRGVRVIVFPGSNCERDIVVALDAIMPRPCVRVWHTETHLPTSDLIVLPGGFSFGDYLRPAAIACASPVMQEVRKHAARGTPILGICNGFQLLCEAGLLEGTLRPNAHLQFVCRVVPLRVEQARAPFTQCYTQGADIRLPIAHKDGNYFADADTLARLEGKGQIIFRYHAEANPNGAAHNIAGISSPDGRILGMMPHPERYAEAALGGTDGAALLHSLLEWITQ